MDANIPSWKDLAFPSVEFRDVPLYSILLYVHVPLNGSTTTLCIILSSQFFKSLTIILVSFLKSLYPSIAAL